MTNSPRRRSFALRDDASPDNRQAFVDAALAVLRPNITEAWIDALSDLPWASAVGGAVADLRRLGGGRDKGVDLDPQNQDHLQILATLALHTIHAEAWAGRQLVFSADDTGGAIVASVDPDEETALRRSLQSDGVELDGITDAV